MRFRHFLIILTLATPSTITYAAFVERRTKPPHPVIQEFQDVIESDPAILVGFSLMFEQIPNATQFQFDPSGLRPQVRDYHTMLARINEVLTKAPMFGNLLDPFSLTTILAWPLCTQAGFDMTMNAKVNAQFRRILNTWAEFLSSPASRYTLTKDAGGWFSDEASKAIPNFVETYECDPDKEYFGFSSWDDFFTRRFRDGMRPVDAPEEADAINNACESRPFRIRHNVKEEDTFWMKGEPYSLRHMLNNDPLVPNFVGGTVYQSYLSLYNYHRWHSPVDGTIVKVESVPGTYFAVSPQMGFVATNDPIQALIKDGYSQSFMANVATRLIIFIQADNPDIGLMALIAIGMGQVSSCQATVKEGDSVKKGDQLGMFHYGGSTYCMVFRPETKIEFSEEVQSAIEAFPNTEALFINKRIGVVRS